MPTSFIGTSEQRQESEPAWNPTPNTILYGANLPPQGIHCRIHIHDHLLMIETRESGEASMTDNLLDFSSLTIQTGGFNHQYITLRWTTHEQETYWIYTKDEDIITLLTRIQHPSFNQTLHHILEARTSKERHRIGWFQALILCTVLLTTGWWFGKHALTSWIVTHTSPHVDEQLGEIVEGLMLSGGVRIEEGVAFDAIESLVDRLDAAMPDHPFTFKPTIIRNDVVNAIALPGGRIVIYSGLLAQAQSAEELAGVLAHEMNHVVRRHGLQMLAEQSSLAALELILFSPFVVSLFSLDRIAGLSFSRDLEEEADLEGIKTLQAANISPTGFIDFFQRMSKHPDRTPTVFLNHKPSKDRIRVISDYLQHHPDTHAPALRLKWKDIQQSLLCHQPSAEISTHSPKVQ